MTGAFPDAAESRPPALGSAIGVGAATAACLVSADGPTQVAPLLVAMVGVTAYAVGMTLRRIGRRRVGVTLALAGLVVTGIAFVGAVTLAAPLATLLGLVACLLGLPCLVVGLFSAFGGSRSLALMGLIAVFVGVLVALVVGAPTAVDAATSVALVLLSWDATDRALTLGERLGADAQTARLELTAVGSSALVAAAGVLVAALASSLANVSFSRPALALVLGSVVVLLAALYD